jgi:molybdate transport system substrate-binding protein
MLSNTRRALLIGLGALCVSAVSGVVAADRPPTIAAASSLRHVLPEIAEEFARRANVAPRLVFGSSGNLYRQIMQGAPFGVFLSADAQFAEKLDDAGRSQLASRVYAVGKLVWLVPASSSVTLRPHGREAVDESGKLVFKRLAIANPKHAPYGRAARQLLEGLGAWSTSQKKLAIGESATQALQFVMTGGADAALLPLSLAGVPQVAQRSRYVVVDESLYSPLKHRMVLTVTGNLKEREFFEFMSSTFARDALGRAGFKLPVTP